MRLSAPITRRRAVSAGLAALGALALPGAASAGLLDDITASVASDRAGTTRPALLDGPEPEELFPVVEFGSYPATSEGDPAPIEWYVLAEEDGRQLLLSKCVLDCVPYNVEPVEVTWETCTLRAWLNADFLNAAFSDEERARIAEVELANDENPDYGTPGGNPTSDRVFCLSVAEAMEYFGVGRTIRQLMDELGDALNDSAGNPAFDVQYAEEPGYADLVAVATDYAAERGAYVWDNPDDPFSTGGSLWWLRTPGSDASYAVGVGPDGSLGTNGYVEFDIVGVRPALWLNLES